MLSWTRPARGALAATPRAHLVLESLLSQALVHGVHIHLRRASERRGTQGEALG